MYLNCRVKIPDTGGKITSKTIGGTPYVYYEYARIYNKKKKYSEPKRTCIGKRDPEQPAFLYPRGNRKRHIQLLDSIRPQQQGATFL